MGSTVRTTYQEAAAHELLDDLHCEAVVRKDSATEM